MKRNLNPFFLSVKTMQQFVGLVIITFMIMACSETKLPSTGLVYLTLQAPDGIEASSLSNTKVSIKEKNSGKQVEKTFSGQSVNLELTAGVYAISVEGLHTNEVGKLLLSGYKNGVTVLDGQEISITLKLYAQVGDSDFVIEEIFFTGTQTPEGKQYNGDKYFKITNNSDIIKYADGLAIAESEFLTTRKYEYTPNIMNEAFAVQALYRIPGNGKEYAVQPGQSIILCDVAIDHRKANVNSFDLSNADFEWYDEFEHPTVSDVDNPKVPNLEKIYSSSRTLWGPHNRGFTAFALLRLDGISAEEFLRDYRYDYKYEMVLPAGTFPMSGSCYKVPNKFILDAVNLSVESEYQWLVTDSSLDRGWSFCGKIDMDKSRYGKSVVRKRYEGVNGQMRLQDTNNSTDDFIAESVPSMK